MRNFLFLFPLIAACSGDPSGREDNVPTPSEANAVKPSKVDIEKAHNAKMGALAMKWAREHNGQDMGSYPPFRVSSEPECVNQRQGIFHCKYNSKYSNGTIVVNSNDLFQLPDGDWRILD